MDHGAFWPAEEPRGYSQHAWDKRPYKGLDIKKMLNRSTVQIPNDFWQARWWTCWAKELQRKKKQQMNKQKNRETESTVDVDVLDASMDT